MDFGVKWYNIILKQFAEQSFMIFTILVSWNKSAANKIVLYFQMDNEFFNVRKRNHLQNSGRWENK